MNEIVVKYNINMMTYVRSICIRKPNNEENGI